jgi:hypothetical protein
MLAEASGGRGYGETPLFVSLCGEASGGLPVSGESLASTNSHAMNLAFYLEKSSIKIEILKTYFSGYTVLYYYLNKDDV